MRICTDTWSLRAEYCCGCNPAEKERLRTFGNSHRTLILLCVVRQIWPLKASLSGVKCRSSEWADTLGFVRNIVGDAVASNCETAAETHYLLILHLGSIGEEPREGQD